MSELFEQAKEFVTCGVATERAVNKLCRKQNPQTSRDAAEKMIKSGKLNFQEEVVYEAIYDYVKYFQDDFTAKNIAERSNANYYTIQRRLSGLRVKDKIERVFIGYDKKTGRYIYKKRDGCCIWRLK